MEWIKCVILHASLFKLIPYTIRTMMRLQEKDFFTQVDWKILTLCNSSFLKQVQEKCFLAHIAWIASQGSPKYPQISCSVIRN